MSERNRMGEGCVGGGGRGVLTFGALQNAVPKS